MQQLLRPVLLCCLIFISQVLTQDCFKNDDDYKCRLGSKTPYRFVANYNETRLSFPGCTEKKIWMMIRHGTRFPNKKDIRLMKKTLGDVQEKIVKNFEKSKSEFSPEVINRLSGWEFKVDKKQAVHLTEEGENELIDLAERMQSRFPGLFAENYKRELFKFKFTNTQRTLKSAQLFTLGLFGQSENKKVLFPEPEDKDPILRFYKRCHRWRDYKEKNSEAYKERDLFIKGPFVKKLLSDVSKKAGFDIDYDIAKLMYTTCSFETAWNKTVESPWCKIFSLDEMKVLEFAQDLNYYAVDGYGYQLNYDQACPAFEDMFTFLESSDKSLTTVYFVHSGTILKLLSKLGIAKDDKPLTHESFVSGETRNWKVSRIGAFGSNIASVLYDCGDKGKNILVLHQERPVHIPGCPEGVLCPLSIMKDIFPDKAHECNFDLICAFR